VKFPYRFHCTAKLYHIEYPSPLTTVKLITLDVKSIDFIGRCKLDHHTISEDICHGVFLCSLSEDDHFIDIGGIVDYHRLRFLFIIIHHI
jgi:hypothetical protein